MTTTARTYTLYYPQTPMDLTTTDGLLAALRVYANNDNVDSGKRRAAINAAIAAIEAKTANNYDTDCSTCRFQRAHRDHICPRHG
jgi:hypothetical protein